MNTRFNPFQTNPTEDKSAPKRTPKKRSKRRTNRRSSSTTAQEALARIQNNHSMANYGHVFEALTHRGIPIDEIEPKENVLTFHAWKAKGRHVRKGEKGFKVVSWIPIEGKADESGEKKLKHRPVRATLFHISQTDPNEDPTAAPSAPSRSEEKSGMPSWLMED